MAHEIESTDNVILHREKAWHGLGIVVEDAPTPTEACRLAGLDWQVEQWLLTAYPEADVMAAKQADEYRANIRSDTRAILGIVGAGWRPVQNTELAGFCEALAEYGDDVRVESAGSIRGGRKVWFLLKGESFSVRGTKGDVIAPYIAASMGHDGTQAVRFDPTTIRVVCSNTLHMVTGEGTNLRPAAYTIRHSGDISAKLDEAKAGLKLYRHALATTTGAMETLASADVKRKDIEAFWLDVYQRLVEPIPSAPTTKAETRAREKAVDAFAEMSEIFDRELSVAGANAWNALNAFTGWMQNGRKARGLDDEARDESRTHSKLFGTALDASDNAFAVALATFA